MLIWEHQKDARRKGNRGNSTRFLSMRPSKAASVRTHDTYTHKSQDTMSRHSEVDLNIETCIIHPDHEPRSLIYT